MNILFHESVFSLGGTTNAMIDYAMFLNLYGSQDCKCHFAFHKYPDRSVEPQWNQPLFDMGLHHLSTNIKNVFPTTFYQDGNQLNQFIKERNIDIVYTICEGSYGVYLPQVKTCTHAVFSQSKETAFKTDKGSTSPFAFVSEWLSKNCEWPKYVPHIILQPDEKQLSTLKSIAKKKRKELGIESNHRVFGRYGSYNQFNIPFVKELIKEIVEQYKDIHFLFCNTEPFIKHARVKFIEPLISREDKYSFIQMCDGMLHARERGETFGMAIGEFSVNNKPIITYDQSPEKSHLEILGDNGYYYHDKETLQHWLLDYKFDKGLNYNCYKQFNPISVIQKFEQIFLS